MGLSLMVGVPVALASWMLGMILYQGALAGFILLLYTILVLVAIISTGILLYIIVLIGHKLWKGENIWQKL